MRKSIALLIALVIPCVACAGDARDLSLVTQDRNGLHVLMVVSRSGQAKASIRLLDGNPLRSPAIRDYSPERFEKLWQYFSSGRLEEYLASEDEKDMGVAFNYVISIGSDSASGHSTQVYRIPKCGAPAEAQAAVQEFAGGLLPSGSPGLFEPCGVGK